MPLTVELLKSATKDLFSHVIINEEGEPEVILHPPMSVLQDTAALCCNMEEALNLLQDYSRYNPHIWDTQPWEEWNSERDPHWKERLADNQISRSLSNDLDDVASSWGTELYRGAQVIIGGLLKSSHLNEKKGVLMDYNEERERWHVGLVDGSGAFFLKPINLQLADWMIVTLRCNAGPELDDCLVRTNHTGHQIKQEYLRRSRMPYIPSNQIELTFGGEVVPDKMTLLEFGVEDCATLTLSVWE